MRRAERVASDWKAIPNKTAGVVVRAPTFSELCALDLSEIPLQTLHHLRGAISSEINSRKPARGVGLLRSGTARRANDATATAPERQRADDSMERALQAHFCAVLDADWSALFAEGDAQERFYVYIHYDPFDGARMRYAHQGVCVDIRGRPFYVGKGAGDRAYLMRRNDGHGAILRQLRRAGAQPTDMVQIVADGLSERQALELESKLVYFFGSRYDRRDPGLLVNLDIPPTPPIKPMPPRKPTVDAETDANLQ